MRKAPPPRRPSGDRNMPSENEVARAMGEFYERIGLNDPTPKKQAKAEAAEAKAEAARFIATGVIDERWKAEPVKTPTWDEHLAKITAKSATDRATIAPTATEVDEATTAATEPPAPPRAPRRYTAGHGGFILPGIRDDDDDDEGEWA